MIQRTRATPVGTSPGATGAPAADVPVKRRPAARLAVVMGALLLVVPWVSGTANAATGAPPGVPVPQSSAEPGIPATPPTPCQMELGEINPSIPRLKSTLTVSGIAAVAPTATGGTQGRRAVTIRLRLGLSPLADRASVRAHAEGSSVAATSLVSNASGAAVEQQLAGTTDANQGFSLSVPVRDLGLGGAGVYPLAVECVDTDTGELLGERTSVLPWVPYTQAIVPTPIVVLYPFSTAPAMGPDGALVSAAPARQISPSGRLGRLLSTAEEHRGTITWVEDAATADIIATLAAEGSGVEPNVRTDASAALASLVAMERTALGVSPSQYAMADVGALARSRSDALITESISVAETSVRTRRTGQASGSDEAATNDPSVLAWPAGLRANARTVGSLARSGVGGVVLAEAAMPALPGGLASPSGAVALPTPGGSLPALIQDAALSATFDGTADASAPLPPTATGGEATAQSPPTGTERSQLFVADSLQLALTQPDQPRPVVVAPAARWSPDIEAVDRSLTAIEQARWLRPVAASTAMRGELPTPDLAGRQPLSHSVALGQEELPADWVAQAQGNYEGLELLSQILVTPSTQERSVSAANLRSVSGAWRNRPDLGRQVLEGTTEAADALQNGVRIVSAGTITLARDQARIPVTIANDLAEPVRVTLRLQAQPASRLVADESVGVLTVEAGRKSSVEVPATVIGGGELPVDVQLQTPEGADFGSPVTLTLRTTAYAQAAGQIVALAFVALVIGLGVNFVRRRRQGRLEDAGPQSGADVMSDVSDDPAVQEAPDEVSHSDDRPANHIAETEPATDQAGPEVRR